MKKIIITTLLAPFVLSACSDGITIHPEEIDDVVNHIADFTDKTENGEGIPMDDLIDFADAFNEATGQYDIYNSWGEEPSAYLQELAEAAFKLPYTMELERTGDEIFILLLSPLKTTLNMVIAKLSTNQQMVSDTW